MEHVPVITLMQEASHKSLFGIFDFKPLVLGPSQLERNLNTRINLGASLDRIF